MILTAQAELADQVVEQDSENAQHSPTKWDQSY